MEEPPLKQAKFPFTILEQSCKPLDKKIAQFTTVHRMVYDHLRRLLVNYLKERPYSQEGIYNWDPITWHNIIVMLVSKQLWNIPATESDCYMMNPIGQSKQIHITPVEYRMDNPQQGYRLLSIPGAKEHTIPAYRITAVLAHPELLLEFQKGKTQASHELQVAHRCKHEVIKGSSINPCWNPSHSILTDDVSNKNMNHCWHGASFLCPHTPKCIWTNDQGNLLLCRNNPTYIDCKHTPNCWSVSVGWKTF